MRWALFCIFSSSTAGDLTVAAGGRLTLAGESSDISDQTYSGYQGPGSTLSNAGTLVRTGENTSQVSVEIINSGLVNVQGGVLAFGKMTNSGTISVQQGDLHVGKLNNSGTLEVGAGGRLVLTGDWGGSAQDDLLVGSNGTDIIDGQSGDDRIEGRGGDDALRGGWGSDTFVFGLGFGHDRIEDFGDGWVNQDVLEFSSAIFRSFVEVSAAMRQVGTDLLIEVDATNTITLADVSQSSLEEDYFRFV